MNTPFDAQTLAYIELTERAGAPEGAGVPEMRAAYEALRARLHGGRPEGLVVEDFTLAGRPARRYRGGDRGRVLFFHGGGYVVGSLESHDDCCAGLAERVGCEVIALDYRLAPEHPFPAACDDALAAAEALEGPLVLAGDSAGGTLAAGVAVALRGTPLHGAAKITGQVLAYPALGGMALGLPAYAEKAQARLLTTADMGWYHAQWGAPEGDPRAEPLRADDLSGVAPCVAFGAGEDPLRDDAADWAERLRAAGVKAEAHVEEGLPHSYLFARHMSGRAEAAYGRFCGALGQLLDQSTSVASCSNPCV